MPSHKAPGKPFVFPDPNDRSPNENAVIVKVPQILGLYNQAHPDDEPAVRVVQKIKDWFTEQSKSEKWDKSEFAGSECILKNEEVLKAKK